MDDANTDQDAAYSEGYRTGQRDMLKHVHRQVKAFKSEKERWTDVLGDAEKLASLVEHKPEFQSAVIETAIALLLKDDNLEKEWEKLSIDDN